jgi:hypothetical protein
VSSRDVMGRVDRFMLYISVIGAWFGAVQQDP